MRSRFAIVAALALPVLSLSGPALADVMEVGADRYEWVAGGPIDYIADESVIGYDPVEFDEDENGLIISNAHPQSVTNVLNSAGPAQWRARVAELAAKYDISPTLLEAVVWQESRWNEGAVSPVGARGLAQLMPGTAAMMGVDPNDPHANLEGGARYLRMQLDAFDGNIEKALAAYNAGPGRVRRAGGIPKIRETQLYVAAILSRLSQPVRK